MRNSMKLILPVIIAACAFTAGCSATGTITYVTRSSIRLDTFKTVQINLDSEITISKKEKALLLDTLTKKLRENSRLDIDEKGQLEVNIVVTDIVRVGKIARFLFGQMMGTAKVTVEVKVTNMSSGDNICVFTVEGESDGSTIFSGGTDEAIEMAAEKVAEAMTLQ